MWHWRQTKTWKSSYITNASYHCVQTAQPQFELALRRIFIYYKVRWLCLYSNPINPLKDWGTQTRSSIKFVISPLQPEGVSLACGNSEFKPSPFLRYLFLLRFFFHWPIQLHFQNRKQSHLPLLPVLTPVFLIMTSSRHCRYSTWWYTVCLKMHLLMNTWIIPLLFLYYSTTEILLIQL